jgi:hypothetical protein
MAGFAPGAYWEMLQPNPTPVLELANTMILPRAPTVPADEAATVPVKRDFDVDFDRMLFKGRCKVPVMDANGYPKLDREGNILLEKVVRKELGPRQDFIVKHRLTKHPVEYAEAFFPDAE